MTPTYLALAALPDLSVLLAATAPVAAAVALAAAWAVRRRRAASGTKGSSSAAVKVAALAALGCTAYSADTSWRFAADYLDMAGTAERVGMFAAAELALFATALMARQNLATQKAPGLPGTLVWVITTVQVIPAYAEGGPVGGTIRAFVGPILAAMLWHLAMGIELRLHTPGAASHSLIATLSREARERLLSRLGIAARDRDAAQITRDRATTRAVELATRLSEYTPQQRAGRRGRRLTRRLSKAIGRASIGTDTTQRAALLGQLAARRNAITLATIPLPSPWTAPPGGEMPPHASTRVITDTGTEPTRDPGPTTHHTGTEPTRHRGPTTHHTGTEPTRDPGPTTHHTGTEPTRDPGPTTHHTGTEPTRDPGP
ncbi:hypothetical protein, partial [Streptomyces sp. NPDC001508]|uniref:hypothetical protein n=1 Tax=Streptomyces sp. NPDC001508 TaxID=3154656 RepID=UPI0033342CDD